MSLQDIAEALLAPRKGLLAADESLQSAGKRLAAVGLPNNPEMRRQYRELFFTTPGIGEYLSGVILFEETVNQAASDGTPFLTLLEKAGVRPGIKVDRGPSPLSGSPGEVVTEGIDGLPERLPGYAAAGAVFTKWRAIFSVGEEVPSSLCLAENSTRMAQYAALSQAAGLVPMVEPEVLWEGIHSLEQCGEVTAKVLQAVFQAVAAEKVDLAGLILKCNMVLAGKNSKEQSTSKQVADATVKVLTAMVPREVAGVVFLSGGQSTQAAIANLRAITRYEKELLWPISFSFARALQGPALEIWRGKPEKKKEAQQEFLRQLQLVAAASEGS